MHADDRGRVDAEPRAVGLVDESEAAARVDLRDHHRQVVGDAAQPLLALGTAQLGALAFGDVEGHRVEAVDHAGLVDVGHVMRLVEERPAAHLGEVLEHDALALQRLDDVRRDRVVRLLLADLAHLAHGLADQRLRLDAEDLPDAPVGERVALVGIDVRDERGQAVRDDPQSTLAVDPVPVPLPCGR